MKIVRESLFEAFKEDSDPIEDMGIGQRAMIKQWFKTWAPSAKYTIDNNLNIAVKQSLDLSGTQITELPDNLSVQGSLNLLGTKITKLPDNLRVGGYLDLRGTRITKLPKSLKVKGEIYKDF